MVEWKQSDEAYTDILYETTELQDGGAIAKITINRPEVRNAFRPTTLFELPARLQRRPRRLRYRGDHLDRCGNRGVLLRR